MKKTAELTTQQLITIIILIVSFGVLLFFIFRLNLGGDVTNKEICHNSVLMKSKSKIGGSALDCRTNYICISGGGKCEGFSATDTVEIDMGGTDDDRKNRIMKAIADEMADCWWMFGEGKVDYVGLDVKGTAIGGIKCVLCSRIKFESSLKTISISSNELETFLLKNEKSKSVSYSSYLYGVNDVNKFDVSAVDLNNEYIIFTGIGDLGLLKKTANWFASGFDAFNAFFAITPKFGGQGLIPVKLVKQSEMSNEDCTEFLTKA